jgi:hypothetical protein
MLEKSGSGKALYKRKRSAPQVAIGHGIYVRATIDRGSRRQ